MVTVAPAERRARAALTALAPGTVRDAAVHHDGAEAVWRLHADTRADVDPDGLLAVHAAHGWRLLCPGDDEWPARLTPPGGGPLALWVRGAGHCARLTERSVGVAGTHSPSLGGLVHAEQLAGDLTSAQPPITVAAVVSAGISRRALAAAASRGAAVAILAGAEGAWHAALVAAVASRGVVVAMSPPLRAASAVGGPAHRHATARTMLLARLCLGIVVVEADTGGRAMAMARAARARGRVVMAVPADRPMTARRHAGCQILLRSGGAVPVATAADIVSRLPTR
ncbi:DNA-processing protein DprA [Parafrankia elaeagni]|uniref:DNA-processing protein DprA n=1 Tax=Parafrankia elaeagni TaxID=222534 RepID=UPI000380EC13|nr:DNA-processing protein DprA [Parafrankia elaeagni]